MVRSFCAACVGLVSLLGADAWITSERTTREVVAPGAVILDTAPKQVRSTAGGTVAEIRVRDGDQVAAGDVIMRLEDSVTRASLAALTRSLDELIAQEARLLAEQAGAAQVDFPADLVARRGEPAVTVLLASEAHLFSVRAQVRAAEKQQLGRRIAELEREIGGYSVLMTAKDNELALVGQQLKGMRDLRAKNLMPVATLTALERDAVRLEGERRGQLVATIAQAEGRIAEMRLLDIQLDRDRIADVRRDLRETETRIAAVMERKLAAEDRLRRLEIRAPQAGTVHQPLVRTLGEDVAVGEEVMSIVPRVEGILVEANIASRDIGRLRLGQSAVLSFPAPEANGAAKITGTLARIAPDASRDRSGEFYRARIAVAPPECARLGTSAPRPGTRAEVMLETASAAPLAGIWQPLGQGLARALRLI
jgi:HlyD family secretion protein